jgi:hypothetical protein
MISVPPRIRRRRPRIPGHPVQEVGRRKAPRTGPPRIPRAPLGEPWLPPRAPRQAGGEARRAPTFRRRAPRRCRASLLAPRLTQGRSGKGHRRPRRRPWSPCGYPFPGHDPAERRVGADGERTHAPGPFRTKRMDEDTALGRPRTMNRKDARGLAASTPRRAGVCAWRGRPRAGWRRGVLRAFLLACLIP